MIWELEQRHVQEKYHLFKQQVKEQYSLQRQQLSRRHSKVTFTWSERLMLPDTSRILILVLALFLYRMWSVCLDSSRA